MFRIPPWVYLTSAIGFLLLAILCLWQVKKHFSKRWPW